MSYGKLRANFAQVGNGAPGQALTDTYTKYDPFDTANLYSTPTVKNNPDLKPTITSNYELGLEMSFLDRRIGMDLGIYRSLSTDQIFQVPFSTATGYSSKFINAGSIENKGIELQLNGTPQLFVCGHSHIALAQYDTKFQMLWLNPGACGYKGFHQVKTILRFCITNDRIHDLELIELGPRA